jgi:hypothetical protein
MTMDVEIFEIKEFLKAVKAMKSAGGRKSKAADQVLAMRGSVTLFENPFESLRKTKHGESRIAGCVKYDLQEFCRLITVAGNGCIFLLFVGDHNEADAWLEKNVSSLLEPYPALRSEEQRFRTLRADWSSRMNRTIGLVY